MKLFKKMIAMALLCTMLVSLVACGGGDVLKGKWTGTNDDDVEVPKVPELIQGLLLMEKVE